MAELIYIPSKDVYLSSTGDIYTDEQLDDLARIEREWRADLNKSMPRNMVGWLKVFPEATKVARRSVKAKLKIFKQEIRDLSQQQEEYYDRWIAPAHFTEQEEIKAESDKEFNAKRANVERKIKSAMFTLSYINELEGKGGGKVTGGLSEDRIAMAKEVPIDFFYTGKLHKHGQIAVGICPFHTEKTGSFTIYLQQNTWWCYGCQNGGSVVDFVMQQNEVDFLTAVKQILK